MLSETYIKDIKYLEEKIKLIEYIENFCKDNGFVETTEKPGTVASLEIKTSIKSFDYFINSLSDIKRQAQEYYSQNNSSYGLTASEPKLIADISHLQYYIDQYFILNGNKVLNKIHMQTYQKQLDDIFTTINDITSKELNNQLEKFLDGFNEANLNYFDKSIIDSKVVRIILQSIENQVSKEEDNQIDLSLITKYGMENELLHSIKSIILEIVKTQEKTDTFSYIELFDKLNINELTNPELWKKIFGIDNAEILIAEPIKDNTEEAKPDFTENGIISLSELQKALSSEEELYKIFKVMKDSNIKYRIGIVYKPALADKRYKSFSIPLTFSKFKKLIQTCDAMYTFAEIDKDTGEYKNKIEFGNSSDFNHIPDERRNQLTELVINSEIIPYFKNCPNLNKVTFLDNVQFIRAYTFCKCSNLTNINIGNNVEAIGGYAFFETALKEITIPDSTKTIGDYVFANCSNLKTAYLGNGIKNIGDYCFSNTALKEINLPDSTETLGNSAFRHCSNLKTAHLGNGIKTIGEDCFYNTALEEINIPNSTETLHDCAFYKCSKLKSVYLGDGIKTIGEGCFYNTALEQINIPDSTETLGEKAFCDCSNLKTAHLGNGIKTIGKDCFCNTALEQINIPDRFNVTYFFIENIFGNVFWFFDYRGVIQFDRSVDNFLIELYKEIVKVPVDKRDRATEVVAKDIASCIEKEQEER